MNKRRKLFVEPEDIVKDIIDIALDNAEITQHMYMLVESISLANDYQKRII